MEDRIEDARINRMLLNQERKHKRDLITEQANYYSRRNQLEELFMECVEEVRRDISRRKATSIGLHSDLTGTLKAKQKQADFFEFDFTKERFTATDKRKILDLLLANENVLLFLYEKLFPRPIEANSMSDDRQCLGGGIFSETPLKHHRLNKTTNTSRGRSAIRKSHPMSGKPIKFREFSAQDSNANTALTVNDNETDAAYGDRLSSFKNIQAQSSMQMSKPQSALGRQRAFGDYSGTSLPQRSSAAGNHAVRVPSISSLQKGTTNKQL